MNKHEGSPTTAVSATCILLFPQINVRFRAGRSVAQLGRVPVLGTGCRRFESCRSDHFLFSLKFRVFCATNQLTQKDGGYHYSGFQ